MIQLRLIWMVDIQEYHGEYVDIDSLIHMDNEYYDWQSDKGVLNLDLNGCIDIHYHFYILSSIHKTCNGWSA